jgi:hypothetical protein
VGAADDAGVETLDGGEEHAGVERHDAASSAVVRKWDFIILPAWLA